MLTLAAPQHIHHTPENVVEIITTRGALDMICGSFKVGGKEVKVNEYPLQL